MRSKSFAVLALCLAVSFCFSASAVALDRATGSPVSVKVTDADLAAVLADIAKQTSLPVLSLKAPEPFAAKPVTLDLSQSPYWQAIDSICKLEGLVYDVDHATGGLILVPGTSADNITSYAGPVVFKFASGAASRVGWQDRRAANLSFVINFYWELRLRPLSTESVVIDKVTDDKGNSLKVQAMDNSPMQMLRAMQAITDKGVVTPPSPPMGSLMGNIEAPPAGISKFSEVSGRIVMLFAGAPKEISVNDALAKAVKPVREGDWEVAVARSERQGENISVFVTITRAGKEVDTLAFPSDDRFGVWLVDDRGNKYPAQVMPKGVTMSIKTEGGQGQGDAAAVVQADTGGAETPSTPRQLYFSKVPGVTLKLLYVFPTDLQKQEYRFKFKDIPTP